jgi:hypothetical protein
MSIDLLPQNDPPLPPSAPHRTADLLQMNQIMDEILAEGYNQMYTYLCMKFYSFHWDFTELYWQSTTSDVHKLVKIR